MFNDTHMAYTCMVNTCNFIPKKFSYRPIIVCLKWKQESQIAKVIIINIKFQGIFLGKKVFHKVKLHEQIHVRKFVARVFCLRKCQLHVLDRK